MDKNYNKNIRNIRTQYSQLINGDIDHSNRHNGGGGGGPKEEVSSNGSDLLSTNQSGQEEVSSNGSDLLSINQSGQEEVSSNSSDLLSINQSGQEEVSSNGSDLLSINQSGQEEVSSNGSDLLSTNQSEVSDYTTDLSEELSEDTHLSNTSSSGSDYDVWEDLPEQRKAGVESLSEEEETDKPAKDDVDVEEKLGLVREMQARAEASAENRISRLASSPSDDTDDAVIAKDKARVDKEPKNPTQPNVTLEYAKIRSDKLRKEDAEREQAAPIRMFNAEEDDTAEYDIDYCEEYICSRLNTMFPKKPPTNNNDFYLYQTQLIYWANYYLDMFLKKSDMLKLKYNNNFVINTNSALCMYKEVPSPYEGGPMIKKDRLMVCLFIQKSIHKKNPIKSFGIGVKIFINPNRKENDPMVNLINKEEVNILQEHIKILNKTTNNQLEKYKQTIIKEIDRMDDNFLVGIERSYIWYVSTYNNILIILVTLGK
jgi:hypothetical protein